jgi:hypothetical protein
MPYIVKRAIVYRGVDLKPGDLLGDDHPKPSLISCGRVAWEPEKPKEDKAESTPPVLADASADVDSAPGSVPSPLSLDQGSGPEIPVLDIEEATEEFPDVADYVDKQPKKKAKPRARKKPATKGKKTTRSTKRKG